MRICVAGNPGSTSCKQQNIRFLLSLPGKIFQIQGFYLVFLSIFTSLARYLYIILYIDTVPAFPEPQRTLEPDEKRHPYPLLYRGRNFFHFFRPGEEFGMVFAIYTYERYKLKVCVGNR